MQTLGELVSAALQQATAGAKVASLRDAPIEDRSFARVDDYLARELGQIETVPAQTKQAAAAPLPDRTGYDDVRFALKLAEALVHGAHVVEKLAIEGPLNKSTGGPPKSGPAPAGGPAPVLEQPFANARVVTPVPQASAFARAAANGKATEGPGEPKTDREMMDNGPPVIPSGYKKADVERVLKSKIAQHKMLVSLGQIDAANAVLKEAAEIEERSGSLVFTDNNLGTHFPDNEAVRNLTKAQARDANQREAGSFFGEPVKRDNAVAAHTISTQGLKLSQLKIANILDTAAKAQKEKGFSRFGQLLSGSRARAIKDTQAHPDYKKVMAGTDAAIPGLGTALKKDIDDELGNETKKVWGTRGGTAATAGLAGYGAHRALKGDDKGGRGKRASLMKVAAYLRAGGRGKVAKTMPAPSLGVLADRARRGLRGGAQAAAHHTDDIVSGASNKNVLNSLLEHKPTGLPGVSAQTKHKAERAVADRVPRLGAGSAAKAAPEAATHAAPAAAAHAAPTPITAAAKPEAAAEKAKGWSNKQKALAAGGAALAGGGAYVAGRRKAAAAKGKKERPGYFENQAEMNSKMRASKGFNTAINALAGGIGGGALGHSIGGGHGAGTAIGAGLGALGGGYLGHAQAKGEQAWRERMGRGEKRSSFKLATLPAAPVAGGLLKRVGAGINRGLTRVGDTAIDFASGEKGLAQYADPAHRLGIGKRVAGVGAGAAGVGYLGARTFGGGN